MNNVTELNTYANTTFKNKADVALSMGMMFALLGLDRQEGLDIIHEIQRLNEENTFDVKGPFEGKAQAFYRDSRDHNGLSQVQLRESLEYMLEGGAETDKMLAEIGVGDDSIH